MAQKSPHGISCLPDSSTVATLSSSSSIFVRRSLRKRTRTRLFSSSSSSSSSSSPTIRNDEEKDEDEDTDTETTSSSSSSSSSSPTIRNDEEKDEDEDTDTETDIRTTSRRRRRRRQSTEVARQLTYRDEEQSSPQRLDTTSSLKKRSTSQKNRTATTTITSPLPLPLETPTTPSRRSPPSPPPKKTKKRLSRAAVSAISPQNHWIDLQIPPDELRPSATLTTGQCFNWYAVDDDDDDDDDQKGTTITTTSAWGTHDATEWIGVLPRTHHVLSIRETPLSTLYRVLSAPSEEEEEEEECDVSTLLRDYFQIGSDSSTGNGARLKTLYDEWSRADPDRMGQITAAIPGVRVLRQDPWECLISFICSSNNNIPRITLLLERLRQRYGRELVRIPPSDGDDGEPWSFFSFPTLRNLSEVSEQELRELGFGYRAKYIRQTVELLSEREEEFKDRSIEQGEETEGYETSCRSSLYLHSLRDHDQSSSSLDHVQTALTEFCGVGRKVADCVALFSLDRRDAVPVDVHVLRMAIRNYGAGEFLTGRGTTSLTPAVYARVGDLFRERFGSYAGWAHSVLFVAELPSFRGVLPVEMVREMDEWKQQEMAEKAAAKKKKVVSKMKKDQS
eukprot:CAMPEP_0172521056 /NCGR_PEP_ID=MMETSP1066-20121228/292357_1 /TAXON_ID=671091 /ORGANISM="Coscinodiscus wailesii, Strain CCMP2513" /LENGTH=618 /DNA_ID=CAMNT_0013303907 /DNA_START=242 /DNA_END=2099 /DNA_ORIENTATION=+